MADPDRFGLTLLKSPTKACKRWERRPDGVIAKSDHALPVKMWWMKRVQCPNDADHIVGDILRPLNSRPDITTVHGASEPGIKQTDLHPRWSSEDHGASATIISEDRASLPIDGDKILWPEGSSLGAAENIIGQAEYFRDEVLPPAFRNVELVVRASSSTGFNPTFGSLHCYALLDRLVPLATMYRYLKGMHAAGKPVDPRVALPGQPFHSSRPEFVGLADPVPEGLRVFVLPGLKRYVTDIDWTEYEPELAVREATERKARILGAELGWRAILENHLGEGPDGLGFYDPLSRALGLVALSDEPVEEVTAAMHSIVAAHPDYSSRHGQYTLRWLRSELKRLRAKDRARDARIAELRGQLFPTMRFNR